jgi:hypothetical protein
MSTKSSIAYGPNFHLYNDAFDEENVYLELNEADFEASRNHVTLTIPAFIWEHIRQFAGVDLSLAGKTEEQIRLEVEEAVDERIKKYEKQKGGIMAGFLVYGSPNDPREEQIKAGVAYITEMRNRQNTIKEQIDQLNQVK